MSILLILSIKLWSLLFEPILSTQVFTCTHALSPCYTARSYSFLPSPHALHDITYYYFHLLMRSFFKPLHTANTAEVTVATLNLCLIPNIAKTDIRVHFVVVCHCHSAAKNPLGTCWKTSVFFFIIVQSSWTVAVSRTQMQTCRGRRRRAENKLFIDRVQEKHQV